MQIIIISIYITVYLCVRVTMYIYIMTFFLPIYWSVPQNVFVRFVRCNHLARPKSIITTWPSSSSRILLVFRSLCTTPALCRKSINDTCFYTKIQITNTGPYINDKKLKLFLPIAKAISATYILTTFSGKQPYSSTSENNSPPEI